MLSSCDFDARYTRFGMRIVNVNQSNYHEFYSKHALSFASLLFAIYAKPCYSQSKKSLTFDTQYTVHVQLCLNSDTVSLDLCVYVYSLISECRY